MQRREQLILYELSIPSNHQLLNQLDTSCLPNKNFIIIFLIIIKEKDVSIYYVYTLCYFYTNNFCFAMVETNKCYQPFTKYILPCMILYFDALNLIAFSLTFSNKLSLGFYLMQSKHSKSIVISFIGCKELYDKHSSQYHASPPILKEAFLP